MQGNQLLSKDKDCILRCSMTLVKLMILIFLMAVLDIPLPVHAGSFPDEVEGFENGLNGWTVSSGIWEVGVPTSGPAPNAQGNRAHEGASVLATILSGNYTDDRSSRVMSPSFAVPGADQNPRLRFWHWWSIGSYDWGQVQVSADNGASWKVLSPQYTADSGGQWTRATLDLSEYTGQTVRLGFYFESHSYGSSVGPGWYIDEVQVITGPLPTWAAGGVDNFEDAAAPDRWTVSSGIWEVGVPTSGPAPNAQGNRAHEGASVLATILSGNYTDDRSSRVMSPSFAVPGADQNPRLRFWHWWSIGSYDWGQVQVSADNGASWKVLSPQYTADSGGQWTRATLDLSEYTGQTVRLGFYFESHSYGSSVGPGWYIDEVQVITGPLPTWAAGGVDNFEDAAAPDRWTVSSGIWEVGVPTSGPAPNAQGNRAHEGASVLATILSGNYTDDRSSRVMSPSFAVPGADQNPRLRFWHWWSIGSYDWGQVQVSADNGASWKVLSPQYTADSGGQWTRATLDLSEYTGQTVRLGFYFESHSYGSSVGPGWYIDEVQVITGPLPTWAAGGVDNFEDAAAPDRWTVSSGIWEVGVPTSGPAPNAQGNRAHEGASVLATILSGNYTDDRSSRVMSPSFAVPGADQNPRLRFWHWWSIGSYDWGQVQVSADNGASWKVLSPQYTADSGGQWTRATLDLSEYTGQTVRLGFYFESHSYGSSVGPGWYIDEVQVITGPLPTWAAGGVDNFEDAAAPDRWTVSSGIWEVGVPTSGPAPNAQGNRAHEGASVLATILSGNYTDDRSSRVMSPSFAVPGADQNPRLRFWHWWSIGSYDWGQVQVSADNGASWKVLSPQYTADSGGQWTRATLDLSEYTGQTVRLGFYFESHSYGSSVGPGWYIDEVQVITGPLPTWAAGGVDNFEDAAAPDRWTVSSGIWEVGVPTSGPAPNAQGNRAHEGASVLATILSGNYTDDRSSRVMSPSFAVPGADQNPRLRFWHWWSIGSYDWGQVQVSADNGASWKVLSPQYTADSGGQWTRATLDLSEYTGQTVRLGFYFESHSYGSSVGPGWYIDEVELRTGPEIFNSPESFDSGWGDWDTDNWNVWQIGKPTTGPMNGHTGSNAVATLLDGNYAANSTGRLLSPSFAVPAVHAGDMVILRFWQWYQYGTGDMGTVQISQFDGSTWSDWMAIAAPATSGTFTAWQQQTIDLSAYQGQKIRLGFLHTANSDSSMGAGWYIDDVEISSFVPTPIVLGQTINDRFMASGEHKFYTFQAPAGGHLRIQLDALDNLGSNELYARFSALPSAGMYDYRFKATGADQDVFAPNAQAGAWYVMAYGNSVTGAGDFTLSTEFISGIVLTGVTPSHSGNFGSATIEIEGAGFDASAKVSLVSGASSFSAGAVSVVSASRLLADFDLLPVPAGNYKLTVTQGAHSATLAFDVTQAIGAKLETKLIVPSTLGFHAPATLYIEYANTGDTPMPAPLLVLTGKQRPILRPKIEVWGEMEWQRGFWTATEPLGWSDTVQFLGSGKVPGILQPGESISIPVAYMGAHLNTGPTIEHTLGVLKTVNNSPVDWASLKATMRPASLSVEAWEALWQNFAQQVGTTWGEYIWMLDINAAYLRRLGLSVGDLNSLLAFAFVQADGLNIVTTLASSIDASAPTPGLPLVFGRSFPQTISGRYAVGSLGRGWSHNWDYRLASTVTGDVTITGPGGSRRLFQPDSRGGYFAQAGDHGVLTALGGGRFSVREPKGLLRVYRADGKLDYAEEPNGTRITCQFTGDLLTRLDHSCGQSLQIAYSGRLMQSVADPVGRTTTFTYSGDHLVRARYFDGLEAGYTYNAGQTSALAHALEGIDYPGGAGRQMTYDARGRLSSITFGTASGRIDFSYGTGGLITASDTLGNQTRFYLDHRGLVAKAESPLGRTVRLDYDEEYNLTSFTDPAARVSSFDYDSTGDVIQAIDALGNTTRLSYTSAFNQLSMLTDARGSSTRYTHDTKGNLSAITYPNSSAERWTYDTAGNPTQWANRRTQAINYEFDTAGRITTKRYPDGTRADYEYDARGNLSVATNSIGRITLTYDGADRLQQITYPGNRWLAYTYDNAGRRASMTDQLGYRIDYHYDADGRLESMTDSGGKQLVKYIYDTARLARKTLGNGVYTTYAYDPDGQLLSLRNFKPDDSVISFFDYTYDTRGRRIAIATHFGQWTYEYDDLSQLTHAVLASNDPTKVPNQDLSYVYDTLGNRIRTIENGVTTDYTTNNLNQYTKVGAETLTYDADGSLTQKTNGTTATMTVAGNPENRVTSYSSAGGQRQFEYDALGFPSVVVRDGVRQYQVHDPAGFGVLVGIYDNSGALVERQTHAFGTIGTSDGTATTYLTFDGIGNASDATATDASISGTQVYSPFGERIQPASGALSKMGFGGEFGVMQEGDLVYMRARFYDAEVGRFTAVDPENVFGGDLNLNRYVKNNPISSIDPLGLGVIDMSTVDPPERRYQLEHNPYTEWVGRLDQGPEFRHFRDLFKFDPYDLGDLLRWHDKLRDSIKNGKPPFPSFWDMAKALGQDFWEYVTYVPDPNSGLSPNDPIPPVDPTNSAGAMVAYAVDPNDLIGPSGYGTPRFIAAGNLLPYRINFENAAGASAPAQQAVISNPLSVNLDWSTFELAEIGFGSHFIAVPSKSQHFEKTEKMTFTGVTYDVHIEAGIHMDTGEVYARFTILDPVTGLPPPVDIGFLFPEDGTGRGQGHVSYVIRQKTGLSTGTEIRNIANIVFDGQPPIATNVVDPHDPSKGTDPTKEALITLDVNAPISSVKALPSLSTRAHIVLSWSADDHGGAGVDTCDIYVSVNDGPFKPWLKGTKETTAIYTAQGGQQLAFYSIARDNVGNEEAVPSTAQATTKVQLAQGDINGDGAVDISDAIRILQMLINLPATPVQKAVDVNNDDKIGPAEAIYVLQKVAGLRPDASAAYSLADLAGSWDGYGLAAGPGAPWWIRMQGPINPDGSFSFTETESDGNQNVSSGTFNISADGVVTMAGLSSLKFRCTLDSGKSVIVCTDTWDGNYSPGTTALVILTKKAASYSLADLAGTWEVNSLASGPGAPWWERAQGTINADGSFSFTTIDLQGNHDAVASAFNISADGVITIPGRTSLRCTMDSDKTVFVCTDTWDSGSPGTTEIKIFTKKAASYSLADLAGTWEMNSLFSAPDVYRWGRGQIIVSTDGSFSAASTESNGNQRVDSGALNISADGVITQPGRTSQRCAMDSDKTVFVCTDATESTESGTPILSMFTKKLVR